MRNQEEKDKWDYFKYADFDKETIEQDDLDRPVINDQ